MDENLGAILEEIDKLKMMVMLDMASDPTKYSTYRAVQSLVEDFYHQKYTGRYPLNCTYILCFN